MREKVKKSKCCCVSHINCINSITIAPTKSIYISLQLWSRFCPSCCCPPWWWASVPTRCPAGPAVRTMASSLRPILRCLKSLWVTFRLMPVTPWTRRRRCSGSPRHNILPYRHPPSIPKAGMLILKNFSHTASFSPFTKREWQKLKLLLNVTLFFHHSKSFLYHGNFNECFECLYWAYLLYAIPLLLPRSSSFSPLHSKSISKLLSSPATIFLFSNPSL